MRKLHRLVLCGWVALSIGTLATAQSAKPPQNTAAEADGKAPSGATRDAKKAKHVDKRKGPDDAAAGASSAKRKDAASATGGSSAGGSSEAPVRGTLEGAIRE